MSRIVTIALPFRLIGTLFNVVDVLDHRIAVQVVVDGSDPDVASGQYDVRIVDRPNHIHGTELECFELCGLRVDHHLSGSAAKRLRDRCAGNARDLISYGHRDDIAGVPLRLSLLRERSPGKPADSMRRTS